MPTKILSIVGARPQFIKAAPVSAALRSCGHHECIVHTGQHYDYAMSQVFFDELGIPTPDINLRVGSKSHAQQLAEMLIGLEQVLIQEKPDVVIVFGDTNSTLAGALAAAKLGIPLAHVEAGLRSFNRAMPEELNRVLTDHASDILFCPTQNAVTQLAREGLEQGVHFVGDTMYDAVLRFSGDTTSQPDILSRLNLATRHYLVLTLHRPGNVDDSERLSTVLSTLSACGEDVVFPVHPRTRNSIHTLLQTSSFSIDEKRIKMISPLGYQEMLGLLRHARCLLTDSGGLQKESFFLEVPCVTLRKETEWVETVEEGWNILTDVDPEKILFALQHQFPTTPPSRPYGDGQASKKIVDILASLNR